MVTPSFCPPGIPSVTTTFVTFFSGTTDCNHLIFGMQPQLVVLYLFLITIHFCFPDSSITVQQAAEFFQAQFKTVEASIIRMRASGGRVAKINEEWKVSYIKLYTGKVKTVL